MSTNVQQVFAFRDAKSDSFGPPITSFNKAMFMRDILKGTLEANGTIAKHPDDFGIWHLGSFDPSSGRILPFDQPICLGLVSEFKN